MIGLLSVREKNLPVKREEGVWHVRRALQVGAGVSRGAEDRFGQSEGLSSHGTVAGLLLAVCALSKALASIHPERCRS